MVKAMISVGLSVVSVILTNIMLRKSLADKMPLVNSLSFDDEKKSRCVTNIEYIIFSIVIGLGVFVSVYNVLKNTGDILNILRVLSGIIPVICAGCIDYREKRIPNIFPLVLLVLGLVFLLVDFFVHREAFKSYAITYIVACLASFVLMSLAGFITGNGIGAGDIKLISSLGFLCGVNALIGAVLFGTIVCAAIATYLLITKKSDKKGSLPYGPFVAFGYLLTLIVNFY